MERYQIVRTGRIKKGKLGGFEMKALIKKQNPNTSYWYTPFEKDLVSIDREKLETLKVGYQYDGEYWGNEIKLNLLLKE